MDWGMWDLVAAAPREEEKKTVFEGSLQILKTSAKHKT
jgi:hypothetical protein